VIKINYDEACDELKKKNLYDIQKELTSSRKARTSIMSLLIAALLLTLVYGMLEDPLVNTLSNIGNFFTYRFVFIIWSIIAGVSIELAVVILFKLEKYETKYGNLFIVLSAGFLILTALLPALKDEFPFLHWMHTITSGLYALFLFLALVPFSRRVSEENPRLRLVIYIWTFVIYAGSILMLILFQHSAMFELWFFVTNILYLLYLCLVLFEEDIIKKSVKLLMDEENLNLAIEKIFVNLERETKKIEEQKAKGKTKKI
jgi:hypothetical protein